MNPFAWIRRKVAEAFVQGASDGLRAITPDGEIPPADLGELRTILANEIKALPAAPPPPEKETTRRGKGAA
jgi:hypothetical protein